VRYYHAAALLGVGEPERDAHRRACRAILERFGATGSPNVADRILYAVLPVPARPEDGPQLLRLGKLAAPLWTGNLRALAAAQYRVGQYEDAIRTFDEVVRVRTLRAWDWLFLAMAHSRLNHAEESRRFLTQADQWIATAEALDQAKKTGPGSYGGWPEKPEVAALRREAENLVNGAAAGAK
jgi:hypothetical protein